MSQLGTGTIPGIGTGFPILSPTLEVPVSVSVETMITKPILRDSAVRRLLSESLYYK